jgi:hypothetical protein
MTGHDVNEEVLLLMDRLMWRNTAKQEAEEIRACLVRVISQAYEEAIPLVCKYCADGLPAIRDPGGHYIHIVPRAIPHGDEWLNNNVPEGCYAQKLRALLDSLKPAEVEK